MVVEADKQKREDVEGRDWSDWFHPAESHIRFNWVDLKPGQTLFCQGADADSVFIIINGRLECTARRGEMVEVYQLESGQLIGERDVTNNRNRSATAVAREASCLIRITGEEYLRLKKGRIWTDAGE